MPGPLAPESCWAEDVLGPWPSDQERTLAAALARCDAQLDIDASDERAADGQDLDLLDDAALVRALRGSPDPFDLPVLASIDPAGLADPRDRLAYARALDRVARYVSALQLGATRAVAGGSSSEEYLTEVHVEHELAVATGTSQYAAGRVIETARTLAAVFPAFEAALRAGTVSRGHVTVLVDRTRAVADPEALAQIGARALPKALRMTPGQFGGEVEKLVARFDPDATARHERARAQSRRVWARQLPDGLGFLGLVESWPVVRAMKARVDADARALQVARRAGENASTRSRRKAARKVDAAQTHPHHPAGLDGPAAGILDTADATRAEAFAARVLGAVSADGSVRWEPATAATVTVEVVIDLDTLRSETGAVHAAGFGLVDGQAVPAQVARDWARGAALWRRMVTDPVTGHLLDYGTHTYAAEPLRRFVLARDGICRNPVCTTGSPHRLQLDHAIEYPHGSTSTANTGSLCTTSHQLKTARYVDITDSAADGSATWTTGWGQTVHIPPRAYLADPDPPPSRAESDTAADDPPPF